MNAPRFTRIACLGEVMLELIPGEGSTARLNVAGDTYNTAAYLARLGQKVDYITTLGQDRLSDRILAHMADHRIGTGAVARHPTRLPGLYAIETDAAGERSFAYWRDASAARTLFGEDGRAPDRVLAPYDLVLLSGISLAILGSDQRKRLMAAIDQWRTAGGKLAFDSNYRPRLWSDPATARAATEALWRRADIALPSVDDEIALFGDADGSAVIARLKSFGIAAGALKRGADGPLDLADGSRASVQPAKHVVDTTAAGDSFNAGYLAALSDGADAQTAMHRGHALALKVIAKPGAIVDLN